MKFKLLTLSILIIMASGFSNASPAYACSITADTRPPEEIVRSEFEQQDAIFIGTVEQIEVPDSQEDNTKVVFAAEQSFKGAPSGTIIVETASSDGLCGFTFEEEEDYLVYASYYDGALSTSIAGRTSAASLPQAVNDVRLLEQLSNSNGPVQNEDSTMWLPLAVGLIGGTIVGVTAPRLIKKLRT